MAPANCLCYGTSVRPLLRDQLKGLYYGTSFYMVNLRTVLWNQPQVHVTSTGLGPCYRFETAKNGSFFCTV